MMTIRTSIFLTCALTLTICTTTASAADVAESGVMTQSMQAAITPAKALEMLKEGNERFVSGSLTGVNYLAQVKKTAAGQYPFAAVVTCVDSRTQPEIIFDQGIGDMFVARVAGNFVNDDILGSLEFATKVSGARIILVMGHTECGAIKGACDDVELGLLTATLANLKPAVTAASKGDYAPKDSTNAKFVQAVADMNVKLTMQKLRDRSLVLRAMIDKGEIALVGAMYDITTGKTTFYE
jgi:carbonic anhydrase